MGGCGLLSTVVGKSVPGPKYENQCRRDRTFLTLVSACPHFPPLCGGTVLVKTKQQSTVPYVLPNVHSGVGLKPEHYPWWGGGTGTLKNKWPRVSKVCTEPVSVTVTYRYQLCWWRACHWTGIDTATNYRTAVSRPRFNGSTTIKTIPSKI
jgi:hypothetical protein